MLIGRRIECNRLEEFLDQARRGQNARESERELGDEFAKSPLPPDPTPEQAWAYVNAV
jgi:hypothetical protein